MSNNWRFDHSRLKNYQGYLQSGDTINLYIFNEENENKFLCSHDQFTIGSNAFQEVVCHNERLGGNDEVSKIIIIH